MSALAEFERDLIRERVKSGIAAAKASGKKLGRQPGQRPSDRKAAKVAALSEEGLSLRLIGRQMGFVRTLSAQSCAGAASWRTDHHDRCILPIEPTFWHAPLTGRTAEVFGSGDGQGQQPP
jgi:Resolvase, N terminal domain